MVTFYQCLTEYLNTPGTYQYNPKLIKRISNICKSVYDKRGYMQPIDYVYSNENGVMFHVRNYPDSFKKVILGILFNYKRILDEKRKRHEALLQISKEKHGVNSNKKNNLYKIKKIRKKNVKPVFSAKRKSVL